MLPDFDGTDEFETQVLIGDRDMRDVLSWEFSRSLTGIPGDIASGQNASGGKLVPNPVIGDDPLIDNSSAPPTPWTRIDNWPPRRGERVVINASRSRDTEWSTVYTGFIDNVSGGTWAELEITLTDGIDLFQRNVQLQALLRDSPVIDGTVSPACLHYSHVINQCFEASGFYATLPAVPNTMIRAAMQGSMHPSVGLLWSCGVGTNPYVSNVTTEAWGACLTDINATWQNVGAVSASVQLIHRITPENGDTYYIDAQSVGGGTTAFTLKVTPENDVYVLDASGATVASLLASEGNVGRWVVVQTYSTGDVELTSYDQNTGVEALAQGAITAGTLIGRVRLRASGNTRPGAIVLAKTDDVPIYPVPYAWEPSAYIEPSEHLTTAMATTYEWNVQAATVLDKIADATCSHWGIDERGRAQFLPTLSRVANLNAVPTALFTDEEDIFDDLTWSSDWQDTCSQVKTVMEVPNVKTGVKGNIGTVTLFTGNAQDYDVNESTEDFIHSDSAEDWIGVHGVPTFESGDVGSIRVDGYTDVGTKAGVPTAADQMIGSWASGIFNVTDNGDGTIIGTSYQTNTLTRLDPSSFRYNVTAKTAKQTSNFANHAPIAPAMRSKGSPVIRGKSLITWGDGWVFSVSNGSNAQVYEHDCGRYAGDNGIGIAATLYSVLSAERVRLETIEVRPDLDVHLGDCVQVNSTKLDELRMVGVVSEITLSHDADDGLTMSISVVCAKAWQDKVTYAQVEAAYNESIFLPDWGEVEDRVNPATPFLVDLVSPRPFLNLSLPVNRVMQSFSTDPVSGDWYAAQAIGGSPESFRVYRTDSKGFVQDFADLVGGGHGTNITVEPDGSGGVWIWFYWVSAGKAVRWRYNGRATGRIVNFTDASVEAYTSLEPRVSTYSIDHKAGTIASFTRMPGGLTEMWVLRNLADYKAGIDNPLHTIGPIDWHPYGIDQGFTTIDNSLFIARGAQNHQAAYDVDPHVYQFDWVTGAHVASLDITSIGQDSMGRPIGGHNETEGMCIWYDASGTPQVLVGTATGNPDGSGFRAKLSVLGAGYVSGAKTWGDFETKGASD